VSEAIDWALVAARFATFGMAILLFGSAVFPVLMPATAAGSRPRWWRLGPAALVLATVAYLTLLGREVSAAPGWPAPGVVVELAVGTGFGRALMATAACALAVALVAYRWARLALSGAALAGLAFVGHAADGEGAAGALRIGVMALHLLAVGAWLGTLAPLILALTRDPAAAFDTLKRFGALGVAAVFVVVATGLCTLAFVAVEARGALGLSYLRTLGVKLALVAALLGVAGFNRWRLTPLAANRPDRAIARLRLTVVAEQALGAGAVACVALLGQLDPTM
jgi:putative copper resistance protein D